jgi:oligoendopeptidase F
MQINNLNNSTCNVNHKGFIKDYKALKRNVYILQTKNEFCQKSHFVPDLMTAQATLNKFCRENPLRTFLYNFVRKFSLIPKNITKPENSNTRREIFIKEKELALKKQNLTYYIDGKDYSASEFMELYQKETNPIRKELMLKQHVSYLNSFENGLRDLVIKRNELAKNLGYKNFFEYVLTINFDITSKEVENLINDYINRAEVQDAIIKRKQILEKEQGVEYSKMLPSQICPLTDFCPIDDYIKTPEKVVKIVKDVYKKMGFDIDSLEKEGHIFYDLYPEEGKLSRAFCRNFVDLDSVMIFANLHADTTSVRAFLHEMGHAMYDLNVSKYLPESKSNPKAFYNEAIAMMFEKVLQEKNVLADYLPEDVLSKYIEYLNIENLYEGVAIIAEAEFEKEIYNNPNQDFKELRKKIVEKYNLLSKSDFWYVDHYVTNPVRRPVYLKGFILADKIYKAIRESIGTDLNSNPRIAEILHKNIFRYGGFMNDRILSKNLKNLR